MAHPFPGSGKGELPHICPHRIRDGMRRWLVRANMGHRAKGGRGSHRPDAPRGLAMFPCPGTAVTVRSSHRTPTLSHSSQNRAGVGQPFLCCFPRLSSRAEPRDPYSFDAKGRLPRSFPGRTPLSCSFKGKNAGVLRLRHVTRKRVTRLRSG